MKYMKLILGSIILLSFTLFPFNSFTWVGVKKINILYISYQRLLDNATINSQTSTKTIYWCKESYLYSR